MPKAKPDETNDADSETHEDTRASEADDERDDSADTLKPVRPKIGESKDNLRQRSDWFQKRR